MPRRLGRDPRPPAGLSPPALQPGRDHAAARRTSAPGVSGPAPADFPPLGDWSRPGDAAGVAALIEDQAGRILCQLRDDRPDILAPGLWCLPGGGVEPGEGLEAAMRRELAEETGLAPPAGALVPFCRVVTVERRRTRLFVFRARLAVDPRRLIIGEGAGLALLTPAQCARHPMVEPLPLVIASHLASPLSAAPGGDGTVAPGRSDPL
ncbi:MAG: NUDIX domain-containing protein [Alphaproteobacteria bacterium]|nr:MAG: NUDIX domain-containing protein [Alphaproteobacteria bacterium]